MDKKIVKIVAIVLVGGIMMSIFSGCFFKKYMVTSEDTLLEGLGKYRAGATVKLIQEIWASDTDYSFYVDGEPANVSFDANCGYIITFTMPSHDVRVTCETRNTMCIEVP